jgi:hypothetical protein
VCDVVRPSEASIDDEWIEVMRPCRETRNEVGEIEVHFEMAWVCGDEHRARASRDDWTIAGPYRHRVEKTPREFEQTGRGFNVYAEFEDTHGHQVRVQQSSAWGMAHVWIFTNNPDGTDVVHWKPGGGWEPARKPGTGDPPWREGEPLRVQSEGWQGVSPHLSPENCRTLIAALQAHLDVVEREGLGFADDEEEEEDEEDEEEGAWPF